MPGASTPPASSTAIVTGEGGIGSALRANMPMGEELARMFTPRFLGTLAIHIGTPMLFQASRASKTPSNRRRFRLAAAALHALDGYLMWKGTFE